MSSDPGHRHVIGLISDTHGLLREEVHAALSGVELILHAGDVGGDEILDELELIAPVRAVSGNTDAPGQLRLKPSLELSIAGVRIHVSHGHEFGSPHPPVLAAAYDADVIVYGHTHRQNIAMHNGKLVVNPGAAGARRFDLNPSVALLTIENGTVTAQLVEL